MRVGALASVNVVALRQTRLVREWVTVCGRINHLRTVRNQPTRPTQPFILTGSINRVPTCPVGVKAGRSPPSGADNTVIPLTSSSEVNFAKNYTLLHLHQNSPFNLYERTRFDRECVCCLVMDQAYVTLATNDSYAIGALVLGHSLRNTGTTRCLVVMVTSDVSETFR